MSKTNPFKVQSFFFRTGFEYDPGMNHTRSIFNFSRDKEAQFRFEVLEFHKRWGTKATVDAYKVSKPTVYRWKKAFKDSLGRLDSLIPTSTAPKRKRVMLVDPNIVLFIKDQREKYGRLGKEKVKPLLDEFCKEKNLETISISKIGRVIKQRGLSPKTRRIYHNASAKYSDRKLSYKLKIRHSPKTDLLAMLKLTLLPDLTTELGIMS